MNNAVALRQITPYPFVPQVIQHDIFLNVTLLDNCVPYVTDFQAGHTLTEEQLRKVFNVVLTIIHKEVNTITTQELTHLKNGMHLMALDLELMGLVEKGNQTVADFLRTVVASTAVDGLPRKFIPSVKQDTPMDIPAAFQWVEEFVESYDGVTLRINHVQPFGCKDIHPFIKQLLLTYTAEYGRKETNLDDVVLPDDLKREIDYRDQSQYRWEINTLQRLYFAFDKVEERQQGMYLVRNHYSGTTAANAMIVKAGSSDHACCMYPGINSDDGDQTQFNGFLNTSRPAYNADWKQGEPEMTEWPFFSMYTSATFLSPLTDEAYEKAPVVTYVGYSIRYNR